MTRVKNKDRTRLWLSVAVVSVCVSGCSGDAGTGAVNDEYRASAENFERLAGCKDGTVEVGHSVAESTGLDCSVGDGGVHVEISNSPEYLDSYQKNACAANSGPDGKTAPPDFPGTKSCYLRGENYVVVNQLMWDTEGKVLPGLAANEVPRLPSRL